MTLLPAAFNPSDPKQTQVGDFTPLPIGDYSAQIRASEMTPVKDKPEHAFLKIEWEILAGEYAGSILIMRLNLQNSNPVAVKMANQHMKSMCDAMGIVGVVSDSTVLHGKPVVISVIHTKPNSQYGASNDIKKYAPIGAGGAIAGAAPGAIGAPAVAGAVAQPAWAGAASATPAVAVPVATPAVPVAPAVPVVPAVPAIPATPAVATPAVAPVVPATPTVATPATEIPPAEAEAPKTPPWIKPA